MWGKFSVVTRINRGRCNSQSYIAVACGERAARRCQANGMDQQMPIAQGILLPSARVGPPGAVPSRELRVGQGGRRTRLLDRAGRDGRIAGAGLIPPADESKIVGLFRIDQWVVGIRGHALRQVVVRDINHHPPRRGRAAARDLKHYWQFAENRRRKVPILRHPASIFSAASGRSAQGGLVAAQPTWTWGSTGCLRRLPMACGARRKTEPEFRANGSRSAPPRWYSGPFSPAACFARPAPSSSPLRGRRRGNSRCNHRLHAVGGIIQLARATRSPVVISRMTRRIRRGYGPAGDSALDQHVVVDQLDL